MAIIIWDINGWASPGANQNITKFYWAFCVWNLPSQSFERKLNTSHTDFLTENSLTLCHVSPNFDFDLGTLHHFHCEYIYSKWLGTSLLKQQPHNDYAIVLGLILLLYRSFVEMRVIKYNITASNIVAIQIFAKYVGQHTCMFIYYTHTHSLRAIHIIF